jgi:predicted AlkP superfamily pyrophosphatase or phosphodiesterase
MIGDRSRIFVSLGLLLLLGLLSGCQSLPTAPDSETTVILVSIDGFRWDFRERGETPHLDRLAATGVSARKLVPVFPSKTFPNHFTIVTGLYTEHHGLVANNIYDPEFDATYGLSKRDEVANGRWYAGEPIWVTAESQGLRAAPVFWPGSEAEIGGYRPTFWEPYDGDVPDEERVDKVLGLLGLPMAERPTFLTLYFDVIDHAAHRFGPGPSDQLKSAVEHADAMVGRLLTGLEIRGIADKVDVLVVSDHGMSQNSREQVILVDELVDIKIANPVDWDPILGLWPAEDKIDEIFAQLDGAHPNLNVYRREDVPEELHYNFNPRIPPIIGIADDGWSITSRSRFEKCTTCFTGGAHGYDPQLESMGALFVAAGPSLRAGIELPELANIHLYHLMCAILGLEPAPNDGTFEAIEDLLDFRR